MKAVLSALRSLKNKILTMIQRGVVRNAEPQVFGEYPTSQISAIKKTSSMERLSPYGLASVPPNGSLAVKFNVQGLSSNQVGIVYDPLTIPPHLDGEVVVGAFSADVPTYFKFTKQGTIEIHKVKVMVSMDLTALIDALRLHTHTGGTLAGGLTGPPTPPLPP